MTSTTTSRIPLNTFAIGFGLAGLAEAWDAAGASLGLPPIVVQAFWAVAAVAWLWLLVAHLTRGIRSGEPLAGQLRHPGQGPIAALAPITGMLIADDLLTVAEPVGLALFLVSLVAATIFAAWLIGRWLQGGLALESVHGGYLLPTVAAGLVGASVAAKAGLTLLGWGLFGVGVFFWMIMTLLVMIRLAFRRSLPDPLVPTMAILVAPPAVAGLAWFSLRGIHADRVGAMIAGLGVLLVLIQLALLPRYLRLGFSLGFWSFTFPTAAVVADAIVWLRLTPSSAAEVGTVILIVALTILIASIGIRSLLDAVPSSRRLGAETVLTIADDAD
ncbi:MAG: transporter [Actinomycetota bacterium]|nr:transporter [Actinomycetota bacterium]